MNLSDRTICRFFLAFLLVFSAKCDIISKTEKTTGVSMRVVLSAKGQNLAEFHMEAQC